MLSNTHSQRVLDLARQMVRLSGLSVCDARNPDGDIAIECTGLRPGEKLFEELLIDAEAQTTPHPKIRRAVEQHLPRAELIRILDELAAACFSADTDRCRALLRELVPQYTPSGRNFDWMAVMRDEADA